MLTVSRMLTEYKTDPIGIDETVPRFFYTLSGDGARQVSRRITVKDASGRTVWDPGVVQSPETTQIEYAGTPLRPRTRYTWRVEAVSDKGETARGQASFETGLMGSPWHAKWIAGRRSVCNRLPVQNTGQTFTLPRVPDRARLYISALGLYEAKINGRPVTEDCLTPGWTDYYVRVQYQAYDVTKLLVKGENTLSIDLAEGWYAGRISRAWDHDNPTWGEYPMLIAELHGDDELLCATGEDWKFTETDTRMSDIFMGETVDRHVGAPRSYKATVCSPPVRIEWTSGTPVRRIRTLKPASITRRKNGAYIVDFGVNFAGRERFTLKNAETGTAILIRHGEMLRADGTLYTDNLRDAAATTLYCAQGGATETYEPRFTFYGFRYIEVTGWPGELTDGDIEAVALSSALPETGKFHCSHELVNRLFDNIVRGQESNFVDVPTDCPQRDERQGWSGDTQVFANVATYNRFAPEFYAKWLVDLNLGRRDELYPSFAPHPYHREREKMSGEHFFSAGWGDAGIICPYQLFRKYRDLRVARTWLDNMERSLVRQLELNGGDPIVPFSVYGDWLNNDAPTDKPLIATAYLAGMARLVSRLAAACGDTARAQRMETLYQSERAAFADKFSTPGGVLSCRTQTAALLALHFDLMPEHARAKAAEFLVYNISITRQCHLSTGFLGTPLLLPVLTKIGQTELAYRLLEQTTFPSWLFPVTNGATTMWERWNSWTPDKGFGEVAMNSFNHYAYGAVGEWFYETVCGIQPGEEGGFRRFRLAPEPGGSFTEASAEYDSLYGKIASSWQLGENGRLVWRFTVPFGTEADLVMPPGFAGVLPPTAGPGSYEYTFSRA